MSQPLAETYETFVYPSQPVARAQPDYLATIARLRGLQPALPQQARVLELGCATGQNLVAWAERYPQARFVGVDLSRRQIELASQSAESVGLTNVAFFAQDLCNFTDSEPFDYIVAHAVYSWVDQATRDRLLEVCHRHLAPQGVAYVSYITNPGARVHEMLRWLMNYNGRNATNPAERVAAARRTLAFLTGSLPDEIAYDTLIKGEARMLSQQSDAYLLHDHLEPHSDPVYFSAFAAHARTNGLQVLGDGVLGQRWADSLDPESEHELAEFVSDPLARESLRDVVRGRTLRQTLLCHAELPLAETVTRASLDGLYFEAQVRSEKPLLDLRPDQPERFSNSLGAQVTTGHPLAKAALGRLGEAWPRWIAYEDLLDVATQRVAAVGPPEWTAAAERQRLDDYLIQCLSAQVMLAHSQPADFVPTVSQRPRTSAWTREQARRGDLVTSRRHELVQFSPLERQLVELLDGSRTVEQVSQELLARIVDGRLTLTHQGAPVRSADIARQAVPSMLRPALDQLAHRALLID